MMPRPSRLGEPRSRRWQREPERRAAIARARGRDLAAMRANEAAGDREPETAAARVGGSREAVEDALEVFGRYARTRVRDSERDRRAVASRRDGERSAARRVPDRVRQQVREDLA